MGTFDTRSAARPETDPTLTSERRAIELRVRAARRQLDAASKVGDASGIETATRVAEAAIDRLTELTQTFGELTLEERGVNTLLVQAARLFLAGDYERTLALLRSSDPFPADMLFLEHVHVFRAASLHQLALKSADGASPFMAQAREEVAALRALNTAFQPDARVFSPRFLAFFRATGSSIAQSTGASAQP
jgi:hypothetical protein